MNKSKIIKLTSSYISIILGAGFISGKELLFFFARYKYISFFTLIFSCLLFSILLYKQLNIIKNNNLLQYHDFSNLVFSNKVSKYIENITLIFLFVTVSTMLCAFWQTINISFNINIIISQLLIFILTTVVISFGIKFIVIINTLLTPIMFIGIIIIGIYTIFFSSVQTISLHPKNTVTILQALMFSVLYCSFNSLTSIPMMCNLNSLLDSKKTIKYTSILCGFILFLLGSLLIYPMIINYNFVYNSDLPILSILSKNKNILTNLYLLTFLTAIFSTLISTSISLISSLEKKLHNYSILFKVLIIFLALCFSNIGFKTFVSFVYPIFGLLGLVQIYYILKYKLFR